MTPMETIGLHDTEFGARSHETSGKAIKPKPPADVAKFLAALEILNAEASAMRADGWSVELSAERDGYGLLSAYIRLDTQKPPEPKPAATAPSVKCLQCGAAAVYDPPNDSFVCAAEHSVAYLDVVRVAK